jgi:hypothetical protein
MKKSILCSMVLSSLSFSLYASTVICKRVIDAPQGNYVYRNAPREAGKIQNITFNTNSYHARYARITRHGGFTLGSSRYKFVPPAPHTQGSMGEIRFHTGRGQAALGFPVIPWGRIEGDQSGKQYMIGNLFEGNSADLTTFLCSEGLIHEL